MFDGVVITEELIEVEVPAPAVEKAAEEELEVESEDGAKEEKEEEEVVAPAPVEAKVNVAKKVPAASNILSGPWVSGDRSRGCAGWGLGSELNSLRTDLAESCAERERLY